VVGASIFSVDVTPEYGLGFAAISIVPVAFLWLFATAAIEVIREVCQARNVQYSNKLGCVVLWYRMFSWAIILFLFIAYPGIARTPRS
jgi:hypothetical protein